MTELSPFTICPFPKSDIKKKKLRSSIKISFIMETIIIHPSSKEQATLFEDLARALKVPFETGKSKSPYDKAFVSKVKQSRQQAKQGKTVKVSLDSIWK